MSEQKSRLEITKEALGNSDALFPSKHTNEYLHRLVGREGSRTYNKMRKSDDVVSMVLSILKNPIVSANWSIANKNPDFDENSNVLRRYFFEGMKQPWSGFVKNAFTMFEMGFSAFEKIYKPWIDPETGKSYLMPSLQIRLQQTVDDIDPKKKVLTQIDVETGKEIKIPFEYLVFFILDQEGDDYRGNSILRPVYRNWDFKNGLYAYLNIALESSVSGLPMAKIPPEYMGENDPNRAQLEAYLEAFCKGNARYILYPNVADIKIEQITVNPDIIYRAFDKMDLAITKIALAQFMELGASSTSGSYALSETQKGMFLQSLESFANYFCDTVTRHVIKEVVDVNFGPQKDYPHLTYDGLNKEAVNKQLTLLKDFFSARIIDPTDKDVQYIRRLLNLDELTEEELDEQKEARTSTWSFESGLNQALHVKRDNDDIVLSSIKNYDLIGNGQQRKRFLDKQVDNLNSFMVENLGEIAIKLSDKIRKVLDEGNDPRKGLKNVELPSTEHYRTALREELSALTEIGYKSAEEYYKKTRGSKEGLLKKTTKYILKAFKGLPASLRVYVDNKSTNLIEDQTVNLKVVAVRAAESGIERGFTIAQTLAEVNKAIEEFINGNKILAGADQAVEDGIVNGEQTFYKEEVEDQLYAFRYEAIDDGRTTDYCLYLNGRYYSPFGVLYSQIVMPRHFGCRSFFIPVWKGSREATQITVIDEPLPKWVSDFQQF